VKKNEFRRVSVAAERYNPEDDHDSDNEEALVYQKTPEQRQRLKDAVCHNLLFRTLEPKQIDQVLDAMWEKNVQKGDTIIRQGRNFFIYFPKRTKFCFSGDDGDNFYVIDSGIYDIYVSKEQDFRSPIKVGEYNKTGSFGELALLYNQPRSATITASTDGILWVMGRQTFRKLVLKHAFRKRQLYENFLRDLDILKSLTDYERSNVADALIPIEFNENDVIIKQGDEGDRMFFIEDGQCDIYMNEKFHKRIYKGDYFGELALLNHEPRSATIIAASPKVRLASLEVESFERLLGPCMDLIHRNTSKYLK
jgi:cAMP-dependent protein kinase regulator